mgnify:CR=1 FL=1
MSSMKVRPVKPGDMAEWASFTERSNNGTVFHTPAFLDYHPKGRFNNHHLVVETGSGGTVAFVPGALSEIEGETWFRSYPGASYGGPVLEDRTGLDKV